MRKLGMLSVVALGAIFLLISLDHPAPLPAAGPPSDKTISFRIVFGEKQQRREDDSGSLALNEGRVISVTPWRLYGEDLVNPDGSWKVHVKLISFENQPDAPRPMDTSDAVLNYVPAGVTVTVEAPPTATAQVRTAQGDFHFALQALDLSRPLTFRDGDVVVQRTPTPQQISPVPQGANPEEHDYPSICVTRKGVVWIVWQAYQDRGDQVYARYSTPSGWSEPVRLTEQKGDVFHTAVAEDAEGRIWVVWSERTGEDWDLYARTYDGSRWTPRRKLTSADHPNIFHRLVADRSGTLHLVWIGYQDGQSHVLLSTLHGNEWSRPVEVSGPSAWMPDAASDAAGNLYVAWDSYRTGNYDVFLRRINADGSMQPLQQVTRSGKFQAHASLAVDGAGRVWLGWDESGDNWGKDWNRDDQSRSTTLYANRHPRIAVWENGVWKQPLGDLKGAIPLRYNRYVEEPRLACDASGRIWAELQIRTSTGETRADNWAANGHWESFLTSYEGDHWTNLMPIPDTSSRPDGTFQITPGPQGIWMAWINDNKRFGPVGGFQPPMSGVAANVGTHRPRVLEIDAAAFATSAAVPVPQLEAFNDPKEGSPPVHPHEREDVARIRAYRATVNDASLRILRGDFHRHTEISGDGAGDGSVEDYFRYMMDAAAMDTGIISDHSAGGDNEYTWWRTEKAIDLFRVKDFYTPLFGYERSVAYPNGHRNVVFAERGTRTLPISEAENQGKVNSGPILYPYLKQHRGICMLHSLATDQGSDYRDNDPTVEPLVEIYQGYHADYEYAGAPRAESPNYRVEVHGKYQPAGFYWTGLAKGYKLGVESSSDHVSTHSSYTMIYTPSMDRTDIVESMRKRHAYGATDNIIVDFQAVDSTGHAYMMGDAFAAATAPRLKVKVIGTDTLQRVEIIKDGKFVFTTSPHAGNAEFTYVDNEPGKGESWYYVRAIQFDRNLAWSSPIWVKYGGQ
jgi:hypothetical protein